jgi:LmbE family N-acetylglucosaminyl deacetylase
VSPHPDDVAFSAAARVARDVAAGCRVTVVTLFAPAHDPKSPIGDAVARRAEDQRFVELAGITAADGGFTDAIARRPRYRAPRHLFGPLAPDEEPLVEAVRARLQSFAADRVVAPLGVGQHVDHQIAHEAARRLDGEILFYEDTPYVLVPYQLARRLDRLGLRGEAPDVARGSVTAELGASARSWLHSPLLRELARPPHHVLALASILVQSEILHWPRRLTVPRATLMSDVLPGDGKLDAVACYPSQWRLFFPSLEAWGAALERYAAGMGRTGIVERAWRLSP